MNRAAVLIGVNTVVGRNQRLAVLSDAVRGALAMRDWVLAQDFDTDLVRCFTDDKGTVKIGDIQDAVLELLDPMAGVGQLVVYFAGHGINVSGTERWLLSRALDIPSEAVDLETSAIHARQSTIPHVVFISDACRTAAVGIAQQTIGGSSIFPTPVGRGTAKAVDRFYACALGDPSHEVSIQSDDNAKAFRALYTEVLLDVLKGKEPAIIEVASDGLAPAGVIRPWPLRDQLEKTFAQTLAGLKLQILFSQTPDAIIMSDPRQAWIARLDPPVSRGGDNTRGRGLYCLPPPQLTLRDWVDSKVSEMIIDPARFDEFSKEFSSDRSGQDHAPLFPPPLSRARRRFDESISSVLKSAMGDAGAIAEAVQHNAAEFEPRHFETHCGLKLRGATAVELVGARMCLDFEQDGRGLRAHPEGAQADRVLLTLQDGSGVLVPLLPEFIAELHFDDDGKLLSLAYEPSDNSALFDPNEGRRMARRELRELVVSALGRGVFRPGRRELDALCTTATEGPAPDPALVLLLAYALDDAGMPDRLEDMAARMRDAGIPLFYDTALLVGLAEDYPDEPPGYPPGLPLISRGWVGLTARGVALPAEIGDLPRLLRPAIWTHFSAKACGLLKTHLSRPEANHA